ncbi:uncharacterized protein H6S33_007128 [Morchella sextelata]|uniref:uncharacterized protein n=1 Tax=Morchella sextelata TaxID=1174677 RepID=UPI001D04A109|nr:uncharacterized protein H6S33_007128 [Morchella sextelata]KAH0604097.1 hypothetical protein H6S33_007128 [Morchella sextelata]
MPAHRNQYQHSTTPGELRAAILQLRPTPGSTPPPSAAPCYTYNYNCIPTATPATTPYFYYYYDYYLFTPLFPFSPVPPHIPPFSPTLTPPHAAIASRATQTLTALLAQVYSPNTNHPTHGKPLSYAVHTQHLPSVEISLLHSACYYGDEMIVGYLLAMGAAVGDVDGEGHMPVSVAIGAGWLGGGVTEGVGCGGVRGGGRGAAVGGNFRGGE